MLSHLVGLVIFYLEKHLKKCSALYDFCRVADNIADDDDEIENKSKKI